MTESGRDGPSYSLSQIRAPGDQRFSTAQERALRERDEQMFQHQERAKDNEQLRVERAKDNAQRRMVVNTVGVILIVCLMFSLLVAVWSENATTRDWAQSVVTVLLGGLVGAIAGYLAGRAAD